jgi:hypothetical protein
VEGSWMPTPGSWLGEKVQEGETCYWRVSTAILSFTLDKRSFQARCDTYGMYSLLG